MAVKDLLFRVLLFSCCKSKLRSWAEGADGGGPRWKFKEERVQNFLPEEGPYLLISLSAGIKDLLGVSGHAVRVRTISVIAGSLTEE